MFCSMRVQGMEPSCSYEEYIKISTKICHWIFIWNVWYLSQFGMVSAEVKTLVYSFGWPKLVLHVGSISNCVKRASVF